MIMTTPIVDFVKKYADDDYMRLHMPGHKGDGFLGIEKFDITEIEGADVLYNAQGIIKQSEENAALLFESQKTVYSTEGSSLSIRAMLYLVKLYAKKQGMAPFIAAGRNVHKTFLTAAALLDLEVDWLLPDNAENIISCEITAKFLENYLCNCKQKPTAVYITSPDYLGNMSDIRSLSVVCKKYGVLLLVDNAHGAYLKFLADDSHPITLGADMCCDSAHKTLPVLTGGAYLHISSECDSFFAENVETAMSLFASTSPSYLILQSLDMANKYMAEQFTEKLCHTAYVIDKLKKQLSNNGYIIIGSEPLKITIATKSYGYTGYELAELLLNQKVTCEFYDRDFVVMMFTPNINESQIEQIAKVLLSIDKKAPIEEIMPKPTLKTKRLSLAQAISLPCKEVYINECKGKIAAAPTVMCPPAIPIIICGEEIDDDAIDSFRYYGIEKCLVVDENYL